MNNAHPVGLRLLPSGIPGLDTVLGGGVPAFSFNLITGVPGAGKTTLAHQFMFANATPAAPALYFTVLGESPIKMLRYQQQMAFFDATQIDRAIHFVDLSSLVLDQGLGAVLERIVVHIQELQPAIIVVDSFQAVIRTALGRSLDHDDLESFVQRLAVYLTVAEATTFLVGEQLDHEPSSSAVLTIADGIMVLHQSTEQNSVVRKLQVVKSRGVEALPGLHTFRITQSGLRVFPRMDLPSPAVDRAPVVGRIASGIEGLDALLGGGLPAGDAVLVSGPSGTGKSTLATQFIAAGVHADEPGVMAIFEEHPQPYMQRAKQFGMDLAQMVNDGMLKLMYLRPLDLSPDEALHEIRTAVDQLGAKRVVIDSLSGFELALASTFRSNFRESMYRLVSTLTSLGVTVLLTMEVAHTQQDVCFSPYVISFLADDIILLRYLETAGYFEKSVLVVKMRNSDHSHEQRMYEITPQGMVVRDTRLSNFRSNVALSGDGRTLAQLSYPGLTAQELLVLQALVQLQEVHAETLAQRTGIAPHMGLMAALERLIYLNYAVRLTHADASETYRPVAHMIC